MPRSPTCGSCRGAACRAAERLLLSSIDGSVHGTEDHRIAVEEISFLRFSRRVVLADMVQQIIDGIEGHRFCIHVSRCDLEIIETELFVELSMDPAVGELARRFEAQKCRLGEYND